MAAGTESIAYNSGSIAIGKGAVSGDANGQILGLPDHPDGSPLFLIEDIVNTTAIGTGAKATSVSSTALGANADASGYRGTALGAGAAAKGSFSTAAGMDANASMYMSTATGSALQQMIEKIVNSNTEKQ